jgi:UDP-glucuronate 4-epimerase
MALHEAFRGAGPRTVVLHLAALVGVRPSMADPQGYHRVNVEGTLRVLEQARSARVAHFVLASSSSVYGLHPDSPWAETLGELKPISPYAASKLAAEQFTRVYTRLHGLPSTVLRFFTVYGPRQRPDLAIHAFFRNILAGLPVRRFGDGSTQRDYTYIADIVDGIRRAMDRPWAPEHRDPELFGVFNLGNCTTVSLRQLITAIEAEAGRKALVEEYPEQAGDVPRTCADIRKSREYLGYAPATGLAEGLRHFHQWYQQAMADQVPEVRGR